MLDSFTTVMAKIEQSGKTRYEYYSKKERHDVTRFYSFFFVICR